MHVNKTKFERNKTVLKSIITWPVLGKQSIQAKEVYFVPSTNSVNSQDGGPCHVVAKFMMASQGQGLKVDCGPNKPMRWQVRENIETIDFFELTGLQT